MHMAQQLKQWTLDEVHSLPDDGNKYELVRGQLFVTPAPAPDHELVAARLHRVLAPYVEKGSRVDRRRVATLGGRGATGRARSGGGERDQNKAIRAWAQRKGYDVAPRGRIRQELVDQYHKEAGR